MSAMYIKNFDPYDFSKKEIEGVPVYYKNLPWAPCIHIHVVFNTGAFNDPLGKEGLSHFLEHMIFDGSPLLPNKKAIKEWSKLHALNSWNAWTNFYQTSYHLECLLEKFETCLEGMKDMIFKSYLKSEDVEHERKVITQEAWGRLQNQKFLDYTKTVLDNLYHGHTRSRFNSPLGWPDTVAKITHEDIQNWHKENYAKGNFCLVITGAIKEENLSVLNSFLSEIPSVNPVPREIKNLSKLKENRLVKTADEIGEIKEQVEITILRAMNHIPQEKVWMISNFRRLLQDILFERLRIENSLCYGIQIYTSLYEDHAEILMSMKTEEKNIEIVEKEFWKVIQEIENSEHQERFESMKSLGIDQVRSEERLSEDIASTMVRRISEREEKINTLEQDLSEMSSVTYEDVRNFTKEVFVPEFVFTEIILPSKK